MSDEIFEGFRSEKNTARTRKKKRKAKVNLRTKADSLHSSQSSLFVLGRVDFCLCPLGEKDSL